MTWDFVGQTILVIGLGWCFWVTTVLVFISQKLRRMLWMLENPEESGLGTEGIREVIQDHARATRELSHYTRWSIKVQTGQDPPPFMEPPEGR